MIEQSVSLASNGTAKLPGYEQLVRFGYTKNRGVYRLHVDATGEWEGLTIRCFWHVPDGKDPSSSLVVDGYVDVPASVTAQPGNGCITFEGSDGTKTVTSADLRYRVSVNSGTEDGTEPEPGTPAWQQLMDAVHTDAAAAEQAKTDAQTAATESAASADKAAGSEKAAGDAQAKAAESLQELKDGIASGNFKGEPGTSPTVTVQDIAGGHRIVITDATGTSSVDVMDGKQGDPGKPGDTGATPELTIGTVEEGDAPSATITGTAKNPVLNLTLKSGAPGKDATVDATLSQSGKAADAKVTGDELARKAVIDDTAVGTAPWSSKHIVDMLCPPISETGNPVVCYPVSSYPLSVKASWEPTQEGSGDPSPDSVRPIKGRDSVTVERCGTNLSRISDISTPNKSLIAVELPTEIVADVEISFDTLNAEIEELGTMLFMNCVDGKRKAITVQKFGISTAGKIPNGRKTAVFRGVTFKTVETVVLERGYCKWSGDVNNFCVSIVPNTPYAPYIGHTVTLTLPHTIYGGTVDAVAGEGQETWKLVTLDGTEKWMVSGKFLDNKTDWYYVSSKIPNAVNAAPQKGNEICSHYPHADIANTNTAQGCAIVWGAIRVRWGDTIPDDADAWKAYLAAQYAAGTPVQIAYKLAEPVPFTVTGAQPISALSGVNTLLTDADSVTVTGRADPIKRITDLEDAVASMTTN